MSGPHVPRPKRWKRLLWLSGGTGVVLIGFGLALLASDAFWNALNPVLHRDVLYRCAGEFKIDPLLGAAVISAESKFNPVATSKKRALGLMQLMPATAFEAAQELHLDIVNEEELYQPDVNIRLGFYYLAKLLREFNGHRVFALAAYNAGLTKARVWAEAYHGEPEGQIIRRIPIGETRRFVRTVLTTYRRYKWMQSVRQFLRGTS